MVIVPFKTEIYISKLDPSFTEGVLDQVLKIQTYEQLSLLSNVGGWQSPSYTPDQQEFMSPLISEIKKYISEVYDSMSVRGSGDIVNYWFNVNQKNDYNISHSHPGSYFSVVLYLKTPDDSGNIVFERPDNLREIIAFNTPNEHNYGDYRIVPQENLMLIFPSFLYHHVTRNNSDQPRVSISFNIK
jgi:uncharacterized protein (TIGR02466 family)